MTIFIALVLTVLTFAFIVYPLLTRRPRSVAAVGDEKLRELHSRRDTTYYMLKELEFDLQSGILSEEDYQGLETRYKRKAISILRNIDGLESSTGVEEEIEHQVRELRRGKSTRVDDELESEILKLRRGKGRFCPQCGARCQEGDRFCSRCGTSLSQGERVD